MNALVIIGGIVATLTVLGACIVAVEFWGPVLGLLAVVAMGVEE